MAIEVVNNLGQVRSAALPQQTQIVVSDTVLSVATAGINLSVPSGYQHLRIVINARGDRVANTDDVYIRFNGDASAIYDTQILSGSAAVASASESLAATFATAGTFAAASATASNGGQFTIDINDYTNTSFHKTFVCTNGYSIGTGSGNLFSRIVLGKWRSTAAITSIIVGAVNSQFAAGSRVTVYASGVLTPTSYAAGSTLPVAYATTLPASPVDGQEAILVDSLTIPTYQWRFRYNNGSSNTDKWEFIGGTTRVVNIVTSEAINSNTYVDLSTAGPSFTVPRAGQYMVDWGCEFSAPLGSATLDNYVTVKIGAAAASDTNAAAAKGSDVGTQNRESLAGNALQITAAASDVLKMQYRGGAAVATNNALKRFLKVTPIRVS